MCNQHLCELNCASRFLLGMGKSTVGGGLEGGAWQMLCKISQLSRGVSSDDENTGQESGVLISTEFSLLSSCCLKIFFSLQSNCFIAMQGVRVSQQKTMDKHYQYWRSPWWSQGWQGEVRLSGMRTGTCITLITHVVFLKTSVVKNDSRHTLSHQYLRKNCLGQFVEEYWWNWFYWSIKQSCQQENKFFYHKSLACVNI